MILGKFTVEITKAEKWLEIFFITRFGKILKGVKPVGDIKWPRNLICFLLKWLHMPGILYRVYWEWKIRKSFKSQRFVTTLDKNSHKPLTINTFYTILITIYTYYYSNYLFNVGQLVKLICLRYHEILL